MDIGNSYTYVDSWYIRFYFQYSCRSSYSGVLWINAFDGVFETGSQLSIEASKLSIEYCNPSHLNVTKVNCNVMVFIYHW